MAPPLTWVPTMAKTHKMFQNINSAQLASTGGQVAYFKKICFFS